jgi:DNA-binding transcriptional ArsR family regulator
MKASPRQKHDREREMTPALIYALNHPVRRQILRLLSEPGGEASPSEMCQSVSVGLSAFSFHALVLSELGVTRGTRTQQVRGALEHFYVSNVSGNELVEAILLETEVDDGHRP